MAFRIPEGRALRQGDLISNARAFEIRSMDGDKPAGIVRTYGLSVIVTQDCDLEQDYKARFPTSGTDTNPDKLLFGILLCGVHEEATLKAGMHRPNAQKFGSKEWRPVEQNQSPRYQYFGWVPPLGKQLVADFKDSFMVPCDFLYAELDAHSAQRAVQMDSPYKEHLLQRFAWYLMRVGLPIDFHMLPSGNSA